MSGITRSRVGTRVRPIGSSRSSSRRGGGCASPPATTSSPSIATASWQRCAPARCEKGLASPYLAASPTQTSMTSDIDLIALVPEAAYPKLVCEGPTIAAAFRDRGAEVAASLRSAGIGHADYYRANDRLPMHIARELGLVSLLGDDDRLRYRGARSCLPGDCRVDPEIAWLLGMYVAEGYRRANQFVVSNTDQARLDRIEAALRQLGLPVYRAPGAVTCCSKLASDFLGWLGTGGKAPTKRVPGCVFGWPLPLIAAFLDGVVDGDGSREEARTSMWTTSDGLVGRHPAAVLAPRIARRGTSWRSRGQLSVLPDLLADTRAQAPDLGAVARSTPRCRPRRR